MCPWIPHGRNCVGEERGNVAALTRQRRRHCRGGGWSVDLNFHGQHCGLLGLHLPLSQGRDHPSAVPSRCSDVHTTRTRCCPARHAPRRVHCGTLCKSPPHSRRSCWRALTPSTTVDCRRKAHTSHNVPMNAGLSYESTSLQKPRTVPRLDSGCVLGRGGPAAAIFPRYCCKMGRSG